ncbi:biotin/lipoyl-containing protein [Nocardia vaccinii]|uniref:biotin/lipoyl-containing protein n=1 Tax=Nocardia vaccinii TaxID=1822 RepID=UPI000AE2CB5F|nr:biotin/lipoyl-containing protein [Nocardia vaccinii]
MTSTTTHNETTMPLPDLGENVTEATVTRWLKQPGDEVAIDEPILEVATDKVDTEITSPVAGILLRIIADEDTIVSIGDTLAVIGASHPMLPTPEPVPTPYAVEQAPTPSPAPAPADDPVEPAPAPGPPPNKVQPTATSADRVTKKLPRIRQTIARRMMESLHS